MKIFSTNYQKSFTLIEILVVITIIGILSSMILVSLQDAKEQAMIAKAKTEARGIFTAITMLESDTGEWPGHQIPYDTSVTSNNELCQDGCLYSLSDCYAGLICNPSPPNAYQDWQGPYLQEIPKDPWGREYFFDTDYKVGEKWGFVIGSYGPNGVGRNLYDQDDVFYLIGYQP